MPSSNEFDKKLSETDAYLQILIEQIKVSFALPTLQRHNCLRINVSASHSFIHSVIICT